MPSLPGVALRAVLRAPRRSAVVSATVLGGSAALVFMMGMNAGLSRLTIANATELLLGHVQVDAAEEDATIDASLLERVDATSGVSAAAPRLESGGLAGDSAAFLLGVDPERERRASKLHRVVAEGRLPHADEDGVALGIALAAQEGKRVGDRLTLTWLSATGDAAKTEVTVTGILRTGSEELDGSLAVVPIERARKSYGAGSRVTRIVARLDEPADARQIADDIAHAIAIESGDPLATSDAGRVIGRLRVRTWREASPWVRGLVGLQRGAINVVLAVVYLVVGAGVAAVQLTGILQRTREFAVLSSIGFTPRRVVSLVALESFLTGAAASLAGALLGAGLVALVARNGGVDVRLAAGGADLSGILGMDPYLVPVLSPRAVAFAIGLVVPVTALGGILPALRAARLTPMEGLRR